MKRTPGPWLYVHGCRIVAKDGTEIIVDDTICGPQIKPADARLIAAAPELLGALLMALEAAGRCSTKLWAKVARAAIKKAGV